MTEDQIIQAAEQIKANRLRSSATFRTDYSREELIAICERGVVSEKKWGNRDSCEAQQQLGACWALLKAGCEFYIRQGIVGDNCSTDARTIWVEVNAHGFSNFDHGGDLDDKTFYLPTPQRLENAKDGDWY